MPAGLGGAVGYALGGLDWTHTFLGAIFKSQEQILFVFAAVLFSASVVLHLLSIEEQQYSPLQDRLDQVRGSTGSKKTRVPFHSKPNGQPSFSSDPMCHLYTRVLYVYM